VNEANHVEYRHNKLSSTSAGGITARHGPGGATTALAFRRPLKPVSLQSKCPRTYLHLTGKECTYIFNMSRRTVSGSHRKRVVQEPEAVFSPHACIDKPNRLTFEVIFLSFHWLCLYSSRVSTCIDGQYIQCHPYVSGMLYARY
jgi:hypothetical protein